MNFNAPLLKLVRILLFPFSLMYGAAVWIRNWLFDNGAAGSVSFNLPIICIGNLAVGGTGKSPMVEYILRRFHYRYHVAVLSRGYKRKTRGYVLASLKTTALDIGDEPYLFHTKFPEIAVAVGEERIVAVPQLLHDRPFTQVIVLDDAYQHRSIKAGMNILLTDYNNLFTRDWFLPTGDLRDLKSSYSRADILVVTKCPDHLNFMDANNIASEIKLLENQKLFFTTIRYGELYHILTRQTTTLGKNVEVLLVTGIANPRYLKKYIAEHSKACFDLQYSDHHIFTIDDWKEIVKRFKQISSADKIIITTEKDAVRLRKFQQQLQDVPIFVLPITIEFLFDEAGKFDKAIETFITQFGTNKESNDEKAG